MSEGFPDYEVSTNECGAGLYIFVVVYVGVSFLVIAPLVVWGRRQEKRFEALRDYREDARPSRTHPHHTIPLQNTNAIELPGVDVDARPTTGRLGRDTTMAQDPLSAPQNVNSIFRENAATTQGGRQRQSGANRTSCGSLFRELDRLATTQYPDNDPDFMSAMSGSMNRGRHTPPETPSEEEPPSQTPSAATTSRLHNRRAAATSQPRTRVWDVSGRKWKRRRPIGRADVIHNAIHTETTQTMGMNATRVPSGGTAAGGRSCSSSTAPKNRSPPLRGMSDVAGSVLSEDTYDDDGAQQERRAIFSRRRRMGSFSSDSDRSFLRGPIDDISPNDAADADDPGRVNSFEEVESIEITLCCGPGAIWKPRILLRGLDGLLDLAEPDREMRRIIGLSVPLTLGAISESLFRAIVACFISHYVGTNSMVAYVLVATLMGFSDEVVGAITDAEGTLCSHALSTGNYFLTGQYVQMAIVVHLCFNLPILAFWALYMDKVVTWLVSSPDIAEAALVYTQVIVFRHLIHCMSRTVTILFHLTGNELFETRHDIGEGAVTLIVVACVVALDADATIETVGWIQVMIAIAAFVDKLVYALLKGWLQPFLRGLLGSFSLRDTGALKILIITAMPLFIGAFLEYGEWTVLLIFASQLGSAEAATWAILGLIWDILEASTEGIGEAAAIRVAFHLGTGNPEMARRSSYKSFFFSTVESLFITSILFMFGKNIATWLTTDRTLQHLLNDAMTLLGISNIVLASAMICWSLVGAQGRYRLATSVILMSRWLVTIPMAVICVYGFTLSLCGIMASVAVGFATASTTLAYVLLRSDWERLSRILQELNFHADYEESSNNSEHESETAQGHGNVEGDTGAPVIRRQ